MICLKNRTFAVSQTSDIPKNRMVIITNIHIKKIILCFIVVICLKNRTFAVSQTSTGSAWLTPSSCDLLEKSYFCSITNILFSILYNRLKVVICLKNRTFAVSQTSNLHYYIEGNVLWFAWKIVLLQYHKHPPRGRNFQIYRCDLLEKSYFCSITNISVHSRTWALFVVICLKNRTFAVSQTSNKKWI